MIRVYTMTGSEVKISGLNPGIDNLLADDFDNTGVREGYGRGEERQIMIKSLDTNTDIVYIAENSGDPANQQYPLLPGKSLVMDYNDYVQSMNEFYATGNAGDVLSVIVR